LTRLEAGSNTPTVYGGNETARAPLGTRTETQAYQIGPECRPGKRGWQR